ncbi:MAG: ammonium transporter [bacterium]
MDNDAQKVLRNKGAINFPWRCGAAILALLILLCIPCAARPETGITADHIKAITAHAQALDIIWLLVASLLIFFMQAGFTLIEIGFTRAKNAGNIVMKNLSDFTVGSVIFLFLGYGLMFGTSFRGLFGSSDFFLSHIMQGGAVNNWLFANLIFQVVFAGTAATIVSGAMAERTKFVGYLIYSLIVTALIYPVVGHWIWGGGWLSRIGMMDFAGSSVVHSLGGWVSLAGIVVLGPRIGRFDRKGKPIPIPGHNIPLAALGVFIMWLGWFGFNTGSVLSGTNPGIAFIAVNTILSGVSGSIAVMLYTWRIRGKPDVGMTLNGVLAGLVTSTATSALVSPISSMAIGASAGIILALSMRLLERFKLDDAVGAISVHGTNGVWGTLAVALFAQEEFSMNCLGIPYKGLFFGGGLRPLAVQSLGVLVVFAWSFGVALAVFYCIDRGIGLRVSVEEEIRGLDSSEHLMSSYPLFDEFQRKQDLIFNELKRVRELSVLHAISRSMHSLNLDDILHLILEGVTHCIGFDRARLYLVNEKERILECRMAVGIDQDIIPLITLPLNPRRSLIARVVAERKPYIIQDAMNDPRVNVELKRIFNLKSFVAVPLQGKDRVMGAISADYIYRDKIITQEKVESLMTFAGQAGLAIENAQLYSELKQFNEELEERVRHATDDLRKTQEQLIQSSRLSALGQLSAGVAHEIRNPLTSIRILIHSLKERLSPGDMRKEDIAVIENEIERINQIIMQFLDFARPRQPAMEQVDIAGLVEETLLLISHELKEHDIRIETDLRPLPTICADRDQVKQVFLNITLNAMQAMSDGGTLAIATAARNDHVSISFRDQGPGISEPVRQRLFEPFFTTKEEGIGLGLSIAKRIIQAHHGTIHVESMEGEGTTFTITLPLAYSERG